MASDEHFLDLCETEAKAAKCTRRKVGAFLVRDGRVVATGRNGTPAGELNCTDGGCPRGLLSYADKPAGGSYADSACIHAEMNALLYADRDHTEGATMYCTHEPCADCFKHLRASGVVRIKTPDFEWNK